MATSARAAASVDCFWSMAGIQIRARRGEAECRRTNTVEFGAELHVATKATVARVCPLLQPLRALEEGLTTMRLQLSCLVGKMDGTSNRGGQIATTMRSKLTLAPRRGVTPAVITPAPFMSLQACDEVPGEPRPSEDALSRAEVNKALGQAPVLAVGRGQASAVMRGKRLLREDSRAAVPASKTLVSPPIEVC